MDPIYSTSDPRYRAQVKRAWERRARRYMNAIAKSLRLDGFEVSRVRYNAGGVAVMGEVTLYARKGDHAVFAEAVHRVASPISSGDVIMYRSTEWPEHLGGPKRHCRTGANKWMRLDNPSASVNIAREAFAPLGV